MLPDAGRDRRADDSVDAQQIPANNDSHNIGNRIDGPNFVKVNLPNRRPMNFRFRFAESE